MIRFCALALVLLPFAAQAGDIDKAQPIPNTTTVTVAVNLECTVQDDLTVKDCVVTNGKAVSEGDGMDAVQAIEASSKPVPNGKPGDKVHIIMKVDH